MTRLAACVLLLACWAGLAVAQARDPADRHAVQADEEALRRVWLYLDDKDCPGAVKALNDGLAKGVPAAWLLAGALYEDGLCLKASRDRATQMFQRAHEAGHRAGRHRLVSALALPGEGQDQAAALWWALESDKHGLPTACAAARPLRQEPERFVALLKTWPETQLAGCVYVAAVMSALAGEIEFPAKALNQGLAGEVLAEFHPAAGRIELKTQRMEPRHLGLARSGQVLREGESRAALQSLEQHIRGVADRVLARHPMPVGVNPGWRASATYTFDYAH